MRVTLVSDEQIRAAFAPVRASGQTSARAASCFESGKPPLFEMIQAMCLRPELLAAFGQFGGAVSPGRPDRAAAEGARHPRVVTAQRLPVLRGHARWR